MDTRLRSDINVTPLVDIVLVLLIVFLVLVPVIPHALKASLPTSGSGAAGPALRLALLAGGGLQLDGRATTMAELPARIRVSTGPVVVRVDPALPFHRVTKVMDLIKGVRPGARVALVAAPEHP